MVSRAPIGPVDHESGTVGFPQLVVGAEVEELAGGSSNRSSPVSAMHQTRSPRVTDIGVAEVDGAVLVEEAGRAERPAQEERGPLASSRARSVPAGSASSPTP